MMMRTCESPGLARRNLGGQAWVFGDPCTLDSATATPEWPAIRGPADVVTFPVIPKCRDQGSDS
jgi:hypothetical protein